ncbi:putative deoxyribonuclease RhsC [compost metagenome]
MIMNKANKTQHICIRTLHLTMIASSLVLLGSSPLVHAQTQNSTYQYEYDAGGNLTKITDPLSRVTNQSYDALYRLTQQQQAIPATGVARPVIGYTYDGLDQLKTVTDPRNLVTTYTMDGLGNRNTLASPDTGSSNATYDAAGNLKTRTDARGKVLTFTYDALNRVTQVAYGSGTPAVFQYDGGSTPTPNAIGRLTRMTDESGQTDYVYGPFGRLSSQTQTVGSGAGAKTFTTSYTYGTAGSSNGKLTSMTYPGGNRIVLAYDVAGRINSIVLYPAVAGVPSGTAVNLLTDIGYAPFGLPLNWTWGNSSPTASNTYARSMDLDGRITGYPLGNALNNGTNRTLTYDAAGRITAITHTGMGVGPAAPANYNQTYAYDGLDRLTTFTSASTNQAFSYDASGNRIQATFGAGTYSNTIAANSNRLDATTGPTPVKTNVHDASGNLTADGTISYTYNDRGRMQTAQIGANTITYSYNGLGQRTKKAGPSAVIAGGANYYVYDEQGHLLGEYDADGKAIQETVFLGDIPVTVLKTVIVGGVEQANPYYIYADHINTPRVITNSADNQIVWRWDNTDPFGLTQPQDNPSSLGVFAYNPRFPGQVYDKETNLHYNYFRDYDPQTGRYVQSDPIGLRGGINTYGYVEGNPISFADPLGLQAIPIPIPTPVLGGAVTTPGGGRGGYDQRTDIYTPPPSFLPEWIRNILDGPKMANDLPNGYWPGDRGAEEWGRRNGVGANDARRRFHGVKQGDKGRPKDVYGVDPRSGDVCNPDGDYAGNLGDAKPK